MRPWDFVHCPPGTAHVFVGAGDGPCVIFMAPRRSSDQTIFYPGSDLARRHGAGVETETSSAKDAYGPFPHWQPRARNAGTAFPGARSAASPPA